MGNRRLETTKHRNSLNNRIHLTSTFKHVTIYITIYECNTLHWVPKQYIRRQVKDTKLFIFANSCHLKKVAVNPV